MILLLLSWIEFSVALSKLTPLAGTTASTAGATTPTVHTIPGELEELQSVLHFPEEVALRITDAEYQLFYQVRIQNLCPKFFFLIILLPTLYILLLYFTLLEHVF